MKECDTCLSNFSNKGSMKKLIKSVNGGEHWVMLYSKSFRLRQEENIKQAKKDTICD